MENQIVYIIDFDEATFWSLSAKMSLINKLLSLLL